MRRCEHPRSLAQLTHVIGIFSSNLRSISCDTDYVCLTFALRSTNGSSATSIAFNSALCSGLSFSSASFRSRDHAHGDFCAVNGSLQTTDISFVVAEYEDLRPRRFYLNFNFGTTDAEIPCHGGRPGECNGIPLCIAIPLANLTLREMLIYLRHEPTGLGSMARVIQSRRVCNRKQT